MKILISLILSITSAFAAIEKQESELIISKLLSIHIPEALELGGILHINNDWEQDSENAFTLRKGPAWIIQVFGGVARHPLMTRDAFALILCHEIGHHLGGAPKVLVEGARWSSMEGQSDYFATLKCLRKLFDEEDNQAFMEKLDPPWIVEESCQEAHFLEEDQSICIRSSMAGLRVTEFFADLSGEEAPAFETPEIDEVEEVQSTHPSLQCRLDTFFQGALCPVSWEEELSQVNEFQGSCHEILGHVTGMRPSCWYYSFCSFRIVKNLYGLYKKH